MQIGIDPQTAQAGVGQQPYNEQNFDQIGVLETWRKYEGRLTWGKGQCLAVLDDGCDLTTPEWQASLPWGEKKVIATGNTMEGGDDPSPRPPAYHGTTVGLPSSVNHNGVLGIAYNDYVAHVRCISIVHLPELEADTIAAGLRWVLERHEALNITTVNLAPVDDKPHTEPVPTVIDEELRRLREKNIWVSAPCANNDFANGISWPACQPHCYAIGAVRPGTHEAYLDRYSNTDILVVAAATSSSNAYAAGCSMILREAIEVTKYPWQKEGETLPEAMMSIFQKTGHRVEDPGSGFSFRELNLLAAVDFVFG